MADAILDPLREWIELATQLTVIYADDPEPSAPRPNVDDAVETYIAIGVSEDESLGSTAYERETLKDSGDPGAGTNRTRQMLREGSLAIEIFGPGAADYGRAIDISRDRQDVIDLLEAAGQILVGAVSEVSDAPRILSTEREPDVSLAADITWVQTETIAHDHYAAEAQHAPAIEEPSE